MLITNVIMLSLAIIWGVIAVGAFYTGRVQNNSFQTLVGIVASITGVMLTLSVYDFV